MQYVYKNLCLYLYYILFQKNKNQYNIYKILYLYYFLLFSENILRILYKDIIFL